MTTENQKGQKCLFIYDKDGTLELMLPIIYVMQKRSNPQMTTTLAEFKKAHPNESKLMIPGMADVVKRTDNLGENVLISGGNPVTEGSNELKDLFPLFQNWDFKGRRVAFGQEPKPFTKSSPEVATAIRDKFHPDKIVIFGDSTDECRLAKNIGADVLLLRTTSDDLVKEANGVPIVHKFQTAEEAMRILDNIFGGNQPPKKSKNIDPNLLQQSRTQR